MPGRIVLIVVAPALVAAAVLIPASTFLGRPSRGEPPGPPASRVMKASEASTKASAWGEMHTYFRGETFGASNAFTALAVVKPGESAHPAHRHAEEEYLVLTEGSGRWHLDGREFPASKGDVLYAAPWVMHGLINTGDLPLTFFVVKWSSKGVSPPAAPPGPHGR